MDDSRSSLGVLLLDRYFDFNLCFEFLLFLFSRFIVEFDLLRLTEFTRLSCFESTGFFDGLLFLDELLFFDELFFDLDGFHLVLCDMGSFLKQQR